MPGRLKTYRAHLGFHDLIVAARSQKAALEAWDAGPHEFSNGFAAVTEDPALIAAAMAKPGVVLQRQFGSKGAFSEQRIALKAPKPNKSQQAAERRRVARDKAADRRRAAREKVAARKALAKKLADLDAEEAEAIQAIEDRRTQVDADLKRTKAHFAERRRNMKASD